MRIVYLMVLAIFFSLSLAPYASAAPDDVPSGAAMPPGTQKPPLGSSLGGAEVLLISIQVGIPYSGLGLVAVIGNMVVLPGERERRLRVGWGMTGIVMGCIGLGFGLGLTVYSAADGEPDMIPPTLPMTIIGATSLALGLANFLKRNSPSSISIGARSPAPTIAEARLLEVY